MADVKLNIAGRVYDVHCADGQEQQLLQLASIVDGKARDVQGGTEVRQLLFAALVLADEAHDAKAKLAEAEPKLDSLRAAIAFADSRADAAETETSAVAEREKVAIGEAANARMELDRLRSDMETAAKSPQNKPAYDRALLQIADRIEALATRFEQMA